MFTCLVPKAEHRFRAATVFFFHILRVQKSLFKKLSIFFKFYYRTIFQDPILKKVLVLLPFHRFALPPCWYC